MTLSRRTGSKLRWVDQEGGALTVNVFAENLHYAPTELIEVRTGGGKERCCTIA